MKAIQFEKFGPPNVLKLVEIPMPTLSKNSVGEILVKVKSAGVNPIDAKIREGSSFISKSLVLPSGLGFDVCGEVIDISVDINNFQVGDIVFGMVGKYDNPCAYSEYCVVKEADVVFKPAGVRSQDAGALPIAGLTAWQALHKHGKVKENDRVLIHAGAGGVGHLAVQIAKLAGAYVIVTASDRHHDFLKQLGVDEIIDYNNVPFTSSIRDVDLVIDLVGGDVGIQSLQIIRPTGRIVSVPTITRDEVLAKAKEKNIEATGMLAEINKSDLKTLAAMLEDNNIRLQIAASFPLELANEAHRLLEEKHAEGKIVLITP